MTHMNEAFCVYIPDQEEKKCPFCDEEAKSQYEGNPSKISVHNDGGVLGDNIGGTSAAPAGLTWPASLDDIPGMVTNIDMRAQAHHLVPGVEALHAVPELEAWLVNSPRAGKKGRKGPGQQIHPRVSHDTGFDVNSAKNGIWLPSAPKNINNWNWEDDEHKIIAFALMRQTDLQFHLGGHTNKGSDKSQCYVRKSKRLLLQVHRFVEKWSKVCQKLKDANAKFPPPYGVNFLIYHCASEVLKMDVSGRHPATWTVFISKVAYEYHMDFKSKHPADLKAAQSEADQEKAREAGEDAVKTARKAASDARRHT